MSGQHLIRAEAMSPSRKAGLNPATLPPASLQSNAKIDSDNRGEKKSSSREGKLEKKSSRDSKRSEAERTGSKGKRRRSRSRSRSGSPKRCAFHSPSANMDF